MHLQSLVPSVVFIETVSMLNEYFSLECLQRLYYQRIRSSLQGTKYFLCTPEHMQDNVFSIFVCFMCMFSAQVGKGTGYAYSFTHMHAQYMSTAHLSIHISIVVDSQSCMCRTHIHTRVSLSKESCARVSFATCLIHFCLSSPQHHHSFTAMVEAQLRQRGAGAARQARGGAGGANQGGAASSADQTDLPNPLTLQVHLVCR